MTTKPTAKDVLNQVVTLRPTITTLEGSLTGFKGTENLEQAMSIHNNAVLLIQGINAITPSVVNVQRPVPLEDGSNIIKVIQEYVAALNRVSNVAQSKKALLDNLPISHLNALVLQDLKDLHFSILAIGDAMIEVAPPEIVGTAKGLRKDLDDTLKKLEVVFSK